MTSKNDQLKILIKRALDKIGVHVSPQVLDRDILRVKHKAVREYITEVKLRGCFCIRKGCGRKLKGRETLFCSTECRNSFHNNKKANARITIDPTGPSRKQAKFRKKKMSRIRKEYPYLKNKVDEQEMQMNELLEKNKKLEIEIEELQGELLVNRGILDRGENLSKPHKLSNPEMELKPHMPKKHRI